MEISNEYKKPLIKEFLIEGELPYIIKPGDLIRLFDNLMKTNDESLLEYFKELNEVISKNILNVCTLLKQDDQLVKRLLERYLDFSFSEMPEEIVKQLRMILRHFFKIKWATREDFEQIYKKQKGVLKKCADSKGFVRVMKILNEMISFSYTKLNEENGSFFFFLPNQSSISANIKSELSFTTDFTLVTWLRQIDCLKNEKNPVLLRIRYSSGSIECIVREKILFYRAQKCGKAKYTEYAIGTLPQDKWICLAISRSESNLLTICGAQVSNTTLPLSSDSSFKVEELTFFENFVGISWGLTLFNKGLDEESLYSIFSQFPQGFSSEKNLEQLETIQDSSMVLVFSPLRFCFNFFFSNIVNSKIIPYCTFKGNCGTFIQASKANPVRYLSYVPEIVPFFHIAAIGKPEDNYKLVKLGLKAFYNWLKSYPFCSRDQLRYIKESRLFLKCFGHLTQFLNPELVDIKIMKVLSEIMQAHASLTPLVFKILLNTLNFWINMGEIPSALFWENIKSSFGVDKTTYAKTINPTQLLLIMETISKSSDYKCCSVISPSNCELNIRFSLILNIIKTMVINNPEISQRIALQILMIMEKRPSHCLFLSIAELVKDLCESNPIFLNYFYNINGLYILFTIAANYYNVVFFIKFKKKG